MLFVCLFAFTPSSKQDSVDGSEPLGDRCLGGGVPCKAETQLTEPSLKRSDRTKGPSKTNGVITNCQETVSIDVAQTGVFPV